MAFVRFFVLNFLEYPPIEAYSYLTENTRREWLVISHVRKGLAVFSALMVAVSLTTFIGSSATAESTNSTVRFVGLSEQNRYIVSGNAATKNFLLAKFDTARVIAGNHTVVVAPKQRILNSLQKAKLNLGAISVYPDLFIQTPRPASLDTIEKKDTRSTALTANEITASALPSDEALPLQWNLFPNYDWLGEGESSIMHGVNAFDAWELFDGTLPGEGVNVSIIDTGYTVHPELSVADSADFTSIDVSNDGDDWDSDGADPGDWCGDYSSSWHGTHVHGTIAADINNGLIAGVAPYANVVHARGLGTCGGYTSDIAAAIMWSAGYSFEQYGVEDNEFPADIINMSLGGFGMCNPLTQYSINVARAAGSLVVVSAGNSYEVSSLFSPASCDGIITVASTGSSGDRAYYSNYGVKVDIAAPGGDWCDTKFSQWAYGDFADCYDSLDYWGNFQRVDTNTILSTLNMGLEGPEEPAYAFYQGTSMAAPHVVGVAALVMSANPSLSIEQVEEVLLGTTSSFSNQNYEGYRVEMIRGVDDYSCNLHEYMCGTGIVNALDAVTEALQTSASNNSRVSRVGMTVAGNGVNGRVTFNYFMPVDGQLWDDLAYVTVQLRNQNGSLVRTCRTRPSQISGWLDTMSCTMQGLVYNRAYTATITPTYGTSSYNRYNGEAVYRTVKIAQTPTLPAFSQISVKKWDDVYYGQFDGIAAVSWSESTAPEMTYGHRDYVVYYVEAYSDTYEEVWNVCATYATNCEIPFMVPGDRVKFRVIAVTTRGETASSWSKWYRVPSQS